MRSRLRVAYRVDDESNGVFELIIDDRNQVNFVFDDRWFRVLGLNTGTVYFACPREHIISIKETS